MTKNFRYYVINGFTVLGSLWVADFARAAIEKVLKTDLLELRWGIWIALVIAHVWFVWRFRDGFFRRGDFLCDERD